jgi:type III secretion protein V
LKPSDLPSAAASFIDARASDLILAYSCSSQTRHDGQYQQRVPGAAAPKISVRCFALYSAVFALVVIWWSRLSGGCPKRLDALAGPFYPRPVAILPVAGRPDGAWRSGDVRALFTRHSDLALAALVISIVGMMIVPLPTFLLDLLISLNVAVAVVLLLISIYVSDALKIATFPTLLLLTTLFRLALEVSATRLILLHADAGEVIHAFGNFVVAGNLVVGAVIFLILTMIQFIVISKGSERVAEVAARFTLDAMPGKQMSIDAELRAGHIDAGEAHRWRATLARESQLFGSMDGAMKFVKGDAIAGIVVLAVNIGGGLIIGMFQRGMDAASAARTYTLLTIGEGLVAQIPALLISTSAGIIVTRVASEEDGGHLGRDIGVQIMRHPRAIAIAAALLALLAVVPGLPAAPFLILAAALGFVAWRLVALPAGATATATAAAGAGASGWPAAGAGSRRGGERPGALPSPLLAPVTIDLSAELSAELGLSADSTGGHLADERIPAVGEQLFAEAGLPPPVVRIRAGVAELPARSYVLRLNEVPLARGDVPPGARDAADRIAADLLAMMRRHGHELIGIQETQTLLDALERTHPALVREVVPKLIAPAALADVLRRLAEEGISLRNLTDILGALADGVPGERDPVALTEHVRGRLRRAITFQHAGGGGVVPALILDPIIEDTIREAVHKTAAGSYLAMEPRLSADIIAAVGEALRAAKDGGAGSAGAAGSRGHPVIVTTADIRRHVRRLIETDHPATAVLSYQELTPDARIQPLGHVRIAA